MIYSLSLKRILKHFKFKGEGHVVLLMVKVSHIFKFVLRILLLCMYTDIIPLC